jgi:perosamine synthetase
MIPISIPKLYQEDKELAKKAIDDNFIGFGPNIEQFEQEFAKFCNRKYAVTCNNGTVALYLAIKALNLPYGSEVILPSMTIISCLTAVVENGLIPVFCDIDLQTWNVDFNSIKSKINSNTSAIIIVNTYGLIVNPDEVFNIKREFPNIRIIEDASESHGANYKDIVAGSIGDVSTFSFYSNKIITMGEGGCVVTDDMDIYNSLLMLRNLNFVNRKKYIHSDIGFNFRLTNLQASIGLGQLHNVESTITERKRIANRYNKNLSVTDKIQLPAEPIGYNNVYWYYSILIKDNYDNVLDALTNNGIDYRHFFYPLHKQPFINSKEVLSNTEYVYEHGVILPTYSELQDEQIDFISKIILEQI